MNEELGVQFVKSCSEKLTESGMVTIGTLKIIRMLEVKQAILRCTNKKNYFS